VIELYLFVVIHVGKYKYPTDQRRRCLS